MRILQSSVFRAICAIIIGALLIKFPDNTVKGITIAIGALFLISGLISCITYFWSKRHVSEYKIYDAEGNLVAGEQPTFPIVGIGSTILGLILALTPTAFVSALMYIIGINQYMGLLSGRRYGRVGLLYWLMPAVILLTGLYVMLKPMEPLNTAMLILGWCMLVYGVVELINALKFYRDKKSWIKAQEAPQQLDTFEEIKDDEPQTPVTMP